VGSSANIASSTETYATPNAPAKVTVVAEEGGFHVYWTPTEASPKITNYIVSAGVNGCAVIVNGSTYYAFLPALTTDAVSITVQSASEYGISTAASASEKVAALSKTTRPLKSVQLLQLSDLHGQIEANSSFGAGLLAANFDADRLANPATVAMASGDSIGAAPPISSQFEELPTILAMNEIGFDVATFGNHEHDRSMLHLRSMIRSSNFQWVASNYSSLRGLNAGGGKAAKTFTIINKGGVKIGFVGMNTSQTVEQVMPGNLDYSYAGKKFTVDILDSESKVEAAASAARKAGADMVVGLVHEGWNTNSNGKAVGPLIDYAKGIKGVDVFYGGHSHLTYSSVLNGKLTAQVTNAGKQYNRTQVCVDTKANKVLGASNELITTANAKVTAAASADAGATAVVNKYKGDLNAKFDLKIGVVGQRTPIAGTPPVQRSGEHAFGNWSADVIRAKYGTDFALVNGGGIRDTFPSTNYKVADPSLRRPGGSSSATVYDVTLGDIYTVQPFGNSFSTIEITGATLWAALENGVSNYPSDGRWPHVSGLKFTVDVTKPKGARIVSVTTTAGKAIPKDATKYSLATTDFIAKGGDGYVMFDVLKLQVRDIDAIVLIDALKADMAAGKTTIMSLDGRITVIK
jgi:2',3'-cyclic-nucleotide 2'-phosphodiesterase (5'-nucleotidase family)